MSTSPGLVTRSIDAAALLLPPEYRPEGLMGDEVHSTSRTTESALAMPSFGQTLRVVARAFRLSCPHCGGGAILATWRPGRPWGAVRPHCTQCGFWYERSDDRYFAGAMLVNLLTAELIFFVSFVSGILFTWPNVPWDAFTYGGAAAMLLLPALLYPVSKVFWLAVDVLVRPVSGSELDDRRRYCHVQVGT